MLADAGTAGQTGPNLDHAFVFNRRQGFDESTFFEVTLEQMKIPGPPMPDFDEEGTPNYLSEDDLRNVAAYVADVAGEPPREDAAAADDPKAIFLASCGSCHTLADAGALGTVGPNLDNSTIDVQAAIRQIANGSPDADPPMPPFKGQLTDEQIRALAEYIVEARGG